MAPPSSTPAQPCKGVEYSLENSMLIGSGEKEIRDHTVARNPSDNLSFARSIKDMFLSGPLNIFLLLIPVAFISYTNEFNEGITFCLALVALASLSERLCFATEQVGLYTNDVIGTLLRELMGSSLEFILAAAALNRGLYRLVQLSMLGSVLCNCLSVLGVSFLFGGFNYKKQYFSKITSQMSSTLLMLSSMAILFPTILSSTAEESSLGEVGFSRATAVILILVYTTFMCFQIATHADLYSDQCRDTGYTAIKTDQSDDLESELVNEPLVNLANVTTDCNMHLDGTECFETVEPDIAIARQRLNLWVVVVSIIIVLLVVGVLSVILTVTIEDASHHLNISGIFLSAIVLPNIANTSEYISAVSFSMKRKPELAVKLAIGSSTKISLCILPLLVLIAWACGRNLSLNFGAFESTSLAVTIISVTFAIKDGTSNWLLGLIMITSYAVVAIGFFSHINDSLS